jgi:hypothetical protein
MFKQGHYIGKKYGNREYLQNNYPNLNSQNMNNFFDDKALKIQSLFINNKYKKYNKQMLNNRINAKKIEKIKNLPKNSISSYFFF